MLADLNAWTTEASFEVLDLQANKVPTLFLRRQKLVLRIPLQRTTYNYLVYYSPHTGRLPFPTFKILTIKQRNGCSFAKTAESQQKKEGGKNAFHEEGNFSLL